MRVCLCVSCRVVVLESRPTDNPTALSNLYILAGHENSYWASRTDRKIPNVSPFGDPKVQESVSFQVFFCCWRWGGEITRSHIYSLKTSNDTLAPTDGEQMLESQAVTSYSLTYRHVYLEVFMTKVPL